MNRKPKTDMPRQNMEPGKERRKVMDFDGIGQKYFLLASRREKAGLQSVRCFLSLHEEQEGFKTYLWDRTWRGGRGWK
jgi:hypothetical protein